MDLRLDFRSKVIKTKIVNGLHLKSDDKEDFLLALMVLTITWFISYYFQTRPHKIKQLYSCVNGTFQF